MRHDQQDADWNELSDEKLIEITLSGNTRAFDVLIRRHSRKLHAMLLQMLGSEADAYDVAQEAFLRAFRSLRYFNGQSAFYTWLYTIAANQARNFIRKRKREHAFSLDNDEFGTPLEKDTELADQALDADPARGAHITDIKARLRAALRELSPAHREVVTLCDIMGLSYQEIAEMLHVSEGTLRSRIFYAHKQLQSLLGDIDR
ncbi:MAG: sigma-70 family RNA polymerase sigma factor [Akkermansiaceae bacterium]|nr:sigma-70 family RNA polymerase sigma factor [Akkermansiaceae bacterium]